MLGCYVLSIFCMKIQSPYQKNGTRHTTIDILFMNRENKRTDIIINDSKNKI